MTKLSLNKAAKEAGIAKATLLEAIRSGRLTAPKNEKGHYEIQPAELFRVFPKLAESQSPEPKPTPSETAMEREIAVLREMLDETRSDRDQWREQAQRITAVIEDKRESKGFLSFFRWGKAGS